MPPGVDAKADQDLVFGRRRDREDLQVLDRRLEQGLQLPPIAPPPRRRSAIAEATVLTVTRDMILPTTITGSYPRPLWFDRSLDGPVVQDGARRFAVPRAVSRRGRQHHRRAGSRRPRHRDRRRQPLRPRPSAASRGSSIRSSGSAASAATATPRAAGCRATACARARSCGRCRRPISPASSREKLTRGPLEYAALWQVAQRMTDRPVKFGAICAPALAGDAVERVLRRRQGDDPRSLRHHERGARARWPPPAAR